MHCATLDIKAKVEYTLVPFMLSFGCLSSFWLYLPSILRSNTLLLIFLYIDTSYCISCVLCDAAALAKNDFPLVFFGFQGGLS